MNKMNTDIFFTAIRSKDIKSILDSLNSGIDVNIQDDGNNWSALHLAAFYDLQEIAELLIMRGAEVNMEDYYGYTPLNIARNSHNINLADLLLKHNAVMGAPRLWRW